MHEQTRNDAPSRARRWSRGTAWFAATAGLAIAAAAAIAPAQAATAAAAPTYLALGDSYAGGQGIGGATGTYASCLQSVNNYPRVAAARVKLELTDRSCRSATVSDLFAPQGDVPAQADALSASTEVVTLTIGGNDIGFAPVLTACIAASATGPVLSGDATCRDKYTVGGVDTLMTKLANKVIPAITDAVARIRAKAPKARLVVVGYPTLMPDAAHTPAGGCYTPLVSGQPSFPFVTSDLAYINGLQAALDNQTQAVVQAAGAEYVSLMRNTVDHSACSADPYIAPLLLSGFTSDPSSMHPNAKGLAYMGTAVANVLAAPRDFQGVTGVLVPQGGDTYQLRISVPAATLFSTPNVTALRNGAYLGHVEGEHGWYLSVPVNNADTRVYAQTLTVQPGDDIRLRTASGAVQVLHPAGLASNEDIKRVPLVAP